MTELAMKVEQKSRAFGPTPGAKAHVRNLAHKRWSEWCQAKADSPTAFRAFLYRHGVDVDWHTSARWHSGESIPGMARAIELVAAGFKEVLTIIFEPALMAGDHEARLRRIREKRQKLEEEARALEQLDEAIRARTGVAR